MGRLFGTDGARGIANSELTCELAMKIGRASAMILAENKNGKPKVLIGTDTRISSDMLVSAISAGLCSVGADVLHLGVVPTPAVAFLVKEYGYDAGVMISASHNPFEYNGIKIFQSDGYKLPDTIEEKIECIILDEAVPPPVKIGGDIGVISRSKSGCTDYINHIIKTSGGDFKGVTVALDCANGSASATAKDLFQGLGVGVLMTNASPSGLNINDRCGSTHVENLQKFVVDNKCDVGFAFDGDADRLIAVDQKGAIVDGDKIIAICAKEMKDTGRLKDNTAVVTVMSNMGFFKFAQENEINCKTTKVGDRYVLEEMRKGGYVIGGEQSGHVIFLEYSTTGDGQLTAVQILKTMKRTGKKLSELASIMDVFPQVMYNVKVSSFGKLRFEDDKEIKKAVKESQDELGDDGRVLVRASGTEPLVRVMLEGKDNVQIKRLGKELAELVRERLI